MYNWRVLRPSQNVMAGTKIADLDWHIVREEVKNTNVFFCFHSDRPYIAEVVSIYSLSQISNSDQSYAAIYEVIDFSNTGERRRVLSVAREQNLIESKALKYCQKEIISKSLQYDRPYLRGGIFELPPFEMYNVQNLSPNGIMKWLEKEIHMDINDPTFLKEYSGRGR